MHKDESYQTDAIFSYNLRVLQSSFHASSDETTLWLLLENN